MTAEADRPDWSDEKWRRLIEEPRLDIWPGDSLEILARWFGLRSGMTIVDCGCGLGYLGYSYWPWFGAGGRYIGIDENDALLADAVQASREWSKGGSARFALGDALSLPLPDGLADGTMAQTLLMHLADPAAVVAEMVRVTRPGGLVVLKEPNNYHAALRPGYTSVPEWSLEDEILRYRVQWFIHRGRNALGRGDDSIGGRLPRVMADAGLVDVDVRRADRLLHLEPPYESPMQQRLIARIRRAIDPKNDAAWREGGREEFLAGGGDPAEFERANEALLKYRVAQREQVERGEYWLCGGGGLYVARGRKPD